ncbi:hypothetical protein [Actinomadura sp. HBU206391]|uniref:hypothetical protein n=1 Tax=Actinomadura sp. HBU206391 TaxID=2731692 RepID=UPI00164F2511|nr:hypothetical protein [Actinomadura sp. HBU206391]MBC6459714.1 hypothetical protein [Actinomadura sp. HBU206391]
MILSSRSYDEYRSMFDLTDGDLSGVTLDCAGGAAASSLEPPPADHFVEKTLVGHGSSHLD